jgi:hypothetical protein
MKTIKETSKIESSLFLENKPRYFAPLNHFSFILNNLASGLIEKNQKGPPIL